eukprot:SAG31_NODE_9556_length_1259_cov_1.240517_1_plen_157_part_00
MKKHRDRRSATMVRNGFEQLAEYVAGDDECDNCEEHCEEMLDERKSTFRQQFAAASESLAARQSKLMGEYAARKANPLNTQEWYGIKPESQVRATSKLHTGGAVGRRLLKSLPARVQPYAKVLSKTTKDVSSTRNRMMHSIFVTDCCTPIHLRAGV